MKQKKLEKEEGVKVRSSDKKCVYFDKEFSKKITRLVEMANKKTLGRKIRIKDFIIMLLDTARSDLIEEVIRKVQDNSLSVVDKRELFIKENLNRFGGNRDEMEKMMMKLMDGYLSQNAS